MDLNVTQWCIATFLSALALATAIYFGLRGMGDRFSDKISGVKDDVVAGLSSITEKLAKIETKGEDLWQMFNGYINRTSGTVTIQTKNFGELRVSAEPGLDDTTYIISVEKGNLSHALIAKASKSTHLNETELKIFGKLVVTYQMGSTRVRFIVPSTDPKVCTDYINLLLEWLDSEYINAIKVIGEFENGIKGTSSN